MRFNWTDQSRAEVRQLWKDGQKSGQIADKFGVSRNAIIGQIGRLGLFGGRAANRVTKKAALPKPPLPRRSPRPDIKIEPVPVVVEPVERAVIEPIVGWRPPIEGVSIMDLRAFHCRWTLSCDDGETRYCGHRATKGSWCAEHRARVFAGGISGTDEAEAA